MRKHIELLGVLYFVWGALFVLIGLALLALAFGTAAIAISPERRLAAVVTAASFAGLAALALIWGLVHIWDAVAVRHGKHMARAVGLVLAILDLVLLPVGTALGVYSLWVLTHDETRPLFHPAVRT